MDPNNGMEDGNDLSLGNESDIEFNSLLRALLVSVSSASTFPKGSKERKLANDKFEMLLKTSEKKLEVKLGVRASRSVSLAFWEHYKTTFPHATTQQIKADRQKVATYLNKRKRKLNRLDGVSARGRLLKDHLWRQLRLGDFNEDVWRKKLSFVPVVKIGTFGAANLARLREVNEQLVKAIRLRGGGTKTGKHKKGQSLGLTVESGGSICNKLRKMYPGDHVSGSLAQLCQYREDAWLQQCFVHPSRLA